MREYFKYITMGLVLVAFGVTGCDEQDVEAPISPENYPTATFTTDHVGSQITEGDTLTYTITLDKMLEYDLEFSVKYDGTVNKQDMEELKAVVLPAYTTQTEIEIIFVEDDIPEENETISLEIGEFKLETRYFLNPATVNGTLDLTVINKGYDPTGLAIAVEWADDADDWDLVVADESEYEDWRGATGNDPESTLLSNDEPDGVYYIELDPWDVTNPATEFKVVIGYPNQTFETFNFTMTRPYDSYAVGAAYRVMKIVKTGSSYAVTLIE